ncbi:hypothetical protein EJ110_NYTH27126 [Nymphaea thermarum]|nr:hypothetical protein EJ110_NYTH27126 [Nymphaea thermarum]
MNVLLPRAHDPHLLRRVSAVLCYQISPFHESPFCTARWSDATFSDRWSVCSSVDLERPSLEPEIERPSLSPARAPLVRPLSCSTAGLLLSTRRLPPPLFSGLDLPQIEQRIPCCYLIRPRPSLSRSSMASASSIQWNAAAALVFVKLNRDNYLLWRSQLESVMDSQDLLPFVDGTQVKPQKEITKDGKTEVNPEFGAWRKMDRLALSWIKATVTEVVLGQIMRAKTAHDAWSTLEKSYGSQSPLRIMLLGKELLLLKTGSMPMQVYLDKIKFLSDALSTAGQDISDQDLVQITRNGLSSEYESFITMLTGPSSSHISFSELFDLLMNQEKRLALLKSTSIEFVQPASQAYSAMSMQDSINEYWYPDTGATNHIIASDDMMHNKAPQNGQENVMIGKASGSFIDGMTIPADMVVDNVMETRKQLARLMVEDDRNMLIESASFSMITGSNDISEWSATFSVSRCQWQRASPAVVQDIMLTGIATQLKNSRKLTIENLALATQINEIVGPC